MSHLTSYKNECLKNVDDELLQLALKEMDIILDYENKTIFNTWIKESVDASFIYQGRHISVGLKFIKDEQGNKTIEVVGDFYLTGLDQEELTNTLAQKYQKLHIIQCCENQNWRIDEEDVYTNKAGEIIINAHRYA